MLFFLIIPACKQPIPETSEKLKVLTTIAPLYSFAKNIAGDCADVDNLLPSGAGPHEYSLSPSDVKKITQADVIIKNGVNLEDWLNSAIASALRTGDRKRRTPIIVDTSRGVELIDNDPHIWLSPKNAVIQVRNIRDALVEVDPANAEIYKKNAEEYIKRLESLDRYIRDEVRQWKVREFVALHSAFKYFAREYGLVQVAVIQEIPETAPTPQHLADVIEIIKSKGIRSVFTEPKGSPKIVESIANDLNLQVYSLDTLETGSPDREWYEEKMKANLEVLKKALNRGIE